VEKNNTIQPQQITQSKPVVQQAIVSKTPMQQQKPQPAQQQKPQEDSVLQDKLDVLEKKRKQIVHKIFAVLFLLFLFALFFTAVTYMTVRYTFLLIGAEEAIDANEVYVFYMNIITVIVSPVVLYVLFKKIVTNIINNYKVQFIKTLFFNIDKILPGVSYNDDFLQKKTDEFIKQTSLLPEHSYMEIKHILCSTYKTKNVNILLIHLNKLVENLHAVKSVYKGLLINFDFDLPIESVIILKNDMYQTNFNRLEGKIQTEFVNLPFDSVFTAYASHSETAEKILTQKFMDKLTNIYYKIADSCKCDGFECLIENGKFSISISTPVDFFKTQIYLMKKKKVLFENLKSFSGKLQTIYDVVEDLIAIDVKEIEDNYIPPYSTLPEDQYKT